MTGTFPHVFIKNFHKVTHNIEVCIKLRLTLTWPTFYIHLLRDYSFGFCYSRIENHAKTFHMIDSWAYLPILHIDIMLSIPTKSLTKNFVV